jgi:cation transport regulator ChaB
MYYKNISDLPPAIKKMPVASQRAYLQAFNECWEALKKNAPRNHTNLTLEEQAKRCALAQIKNSPAHESKLK